MTDILNKICSKCRKRFQCNNGCSNLGLNHGKIQYSGCYCPECARKLDKSEPYPKDLKEVCSRFLNLKEVVEFT